MPRDVARCSMCYIAVSVCPDPRYTCVVTEPDRYTCKVAQMMWALGALAVVVMAVDDVDLTASAIDEEALVRALRPIWEKWLHVVLV